MPCTYHIFRHREPAPPAIISLIKQRTFRACRSQTCFQNYAGAAPFLTNLPRWRIYSMHPIHIVEQAAAAELRCGEKNRWLPISCVFLPPCSLWSRRAKGGEAMRGSDFIESFLHGDVNKAKRAIVLFTRPVSIWHQKAWRPVFA